MKDCNQCGKCCIKYGDGALSATTKEIEQWELYQPHIYRYVKDDGIWFCPDTGKQLTLCPFLQVVPHVPSAAASSRARKKYTCAIYEHRPEDCRLYPSNIVEMIRDECEMLEIKDLNQHHSRRQKL